jgi:hypothetical protein
LFTWPATVPEDSLPQWQSAESAINAAHADFAAARGYAAPIVSFESTNVFVPGTEFPGNTRAAMVSMLNARGISTAGYQFLIAINIDPSKSEGGVTFPGTDDPVYVHVGNYFRAQARLTASEVSSVIATAYHHEVAHGWGWPGTHDWSPSCGGFTADYAPFITAPVLFGWEDTDGDGVPEILDSTPYGRSR